MSSALSEFMELFLIGFADIVKLLRDKKRTIGQLLPLKLAMQSTIDGEYSEVRQLSLRELLLSDKPAYLQEGWRQLYAEWNIECEVSLPEESLCFSIEEERQKGKTLIYLAQNVASWDGLPILQKGLKIPFQQIPRRGLVCYNNTNGWISVHSLPDPPKTCSNIEELTNMDSCDMSRFHMTLNMFMVFFGYCQAIYGPSHGLGRTCFEALLSSKYGKNHPVVVEYSNFRNFLVHRGKLPEGATIEARSIL